MARDEDDDLYDEEFDFVDDDDDEEDDEEEDDEEETDEAGDADDESELEEDPDDREVDETPVEDEEDTDEYGRGKPAADHVVHIYEHQKLKRTIDRPFTAEDAEAFATEYNRASKSYGRFALAGKSDAKPKKALD